MTQMHRRRSSRANLTVRSFSQIRAGIERSRSAGAEYGVRFHAHAGEIEIIVWQGDRDVFRTARRLP